MLLVLVLKLGKVIQVKVQIVGRVLIAVVVVVVVCGKKFHKIE